MTGAFYLPDMEAKRIALDPWRALDADALDAAAALIGKPVTGLTAFVPLDLHEEALGLIVSCQVKSAIKLRLLEVDRFPNVLSWALTDYQITVTSEAPA